jgi:hypothetical protein
LTLHRWHLNIFDQFRLLGLFFCGLRYWLAMIWPLCKGLKELIRWINKDGIVKH